MWLATNLGYFSIVNKQGKYFIRARSVKDLELLKTATGLENEILQFAGTDYIARIIVNQSELDLIMRTLFSTITYSNFKDSISKNATQRDKGRYYTEVWGVMWDYQLGIAPFIAQNNKWDNNTPWNAEPKKQVKTALSKKAKKALKDLQKK